MRARARFREATTSFNFWASLAAITTFAVFIPWSVKFCTQNSDSLLPAIISVTKVTPYFWGQNRFGNLLPLMTAWISDIKANLMTQLVLRALFASLSPILCILVMKPRAPFAMTFGFILMLLLVCLRPRAIWNYWVDSQPYGTSAALLVAAIAVLSDVHNLAPLQRATRQTIAFAILLLATWVNLSLFLVAGPLFVLLALTLRSSQFATLAVLSLVAYALISLHAALIGDDQYAHFTPSLENVTAASRSVLSVFRSGPLMVVLGAAAMVGLFVLQRRREPTRNPYSRFVVSAIILIISATGTGLITANIEWVSLNLFDLRYFLLPVIIVISTCAIILAEILWIWIPVAIARSRLWATIGTATSIATVAVVSFPLDVSCPHYGKEASIAADELSTWSGQFNVTFVAGDYWIVWPVVFDLMRRSGNQRAFGFTHRGDAVIEAVKGTLTKSNNIGMVCFEATLDTCIDQYRDFVGSDMINGRTLKEAMSVVAKGMISGSLRPYQIIRLQSPRCAESSCGDAAASESGL